MVASGDGVMNTRTLACESNVAHPYPLACLGLRNGSLQSSGFGCGLWRQAVKTMMKVRRQTVEKRTREFMDACEFLLDHPLLLWAPKLDKVTKVLVKEVAKAQQRSRAWGGGGKEAA